MNSDRASTIMLRRSVVKRDHVPSVVQGCVSAPLHEQFAVLECPAHQQSDLPS
jgi:hypothetical protein